MLANQTCVELRGVFVTHSNSEVTRAKFAVTPRGRLPQGLNRGSLLRGWPTGRQSGPRRSGRRRARGSCARRCELVARGGYREAQVAAVAKRAGVATGTVYRHFPSKAELFTEVFRVASQREVDAVAEAAGSAGRARRRADRARRARRSPRAPCRAGGWRGRCWPSRSTRPSRPSACSSAAPTPRSSSSIIEDGIQHHQLPEQDAAFTATALVGAIGEALVGPLSPTHAPADADALVAHLTTFCLRATT